MGVLHDLGERSDAIPFAAEHDPGCMAEAVRILAVIRGVADTCALAARSHVNGTDHQSASAGIRQMIEVITQLHAVEHAVDGARVMEWTS